jgi:hypothetical protein
LAPLQAGTITCAAGVAARSEAGDGVGEAAGSVPGAGAADGAGDGVGEGATGAADDQLDPPFEKRQAKYVFVLPGTVTEPQPKRSYEASSL